MRCARVLPTFAAVAISILTSSALASADDCPPGSVFRTENGFTWCEPTVCSKEAPCKENEVCRPIALCMEVGTLADAGTGDGGKRLVVTQRCVAGSEPGDPKTCPQKQVCSDMNRCISKTVAEKLGLLDAPATPSATPTGSSGEAKKSSCGCDVIGSRSETNGAIALGLLAVGLGARRRRADRR
jgi:hypothetical protein